MNVVTVALVVVSVMLAGCAGKTVLMRNQAGDVQRCEVSTTGAVLGGIIARDMALKQCEKEFRAAGYSRITSD